MSFTYASADQLVEHLSLSSQDQSRDDALLQRAVNVASAQIARKCGRRFDTVTAAARTYGPDGSRVLGVDDISTLSGLIVKTDPGADGTFETTLTIGTDFIVRPANAIAQDEPVTSLELVTGCWPVSWTGRDTVQVTAAWGWPSVPDDIVEATLLQAARLYKRKNTPDGIAGAGDFGPVRVSRFDPDVEELVAPFVRRRVLVA